MLAVIAAAALILAFYWLSREQLFFRVVHAHGRPAASYAICFVAVAALAFVPAAHTRDTLLALSLLGCVVQLGWSSAVVIVFAGLVLGIARLKLPVFARIIAVLLIWFVPIVPKFWLSHPDYARLLMLYVCWAGFPFAAIYLVVERARGTLQNRSWSDDALYLLALPRFLTPFYQPISPAKFLASRTRVDLRLALRGLGLGLYGAGLQIVFVKLPLIVATPGATLPPGVPPPGVLRLGYNLLVIYAINAANIFCAVGLFRVLGFDLGSGFRWPLASRSMAEFFRRWNYYIYEEVLSLFFFPIAARLRQWLPSRVTAVVAGYSAIFLGSACLNWILVPAAIGPDPLMGLASVVEPKQKLLMYGIFWGAIIVPQLVLHRLAPRGPYPGWRRALQHVLFLALFLLLGFIAHRVGVTMV